MSIFVSNWAQNVFLVNRENFKIHLIWIRILFVLAMMMTLNRFVLYLCLRDELLVSGLSSLQLFWMGFRFDILVLGFTYLVVMAFSFLRFFFPEEIHLYAVVYLTKKYYFLVWTIISLIYYFNTWFILTHKRHMRLDDWNKAVELKTYLVAQNFPGAIFGMITAALVVSFYLGIRTILNCDDFYEISVEDHLQKPKNVSRNETLRELQQFAEDLADTTPYWAQFAFYFLLPAIVVAFAARGTLTAHHLEYAHSQISESFLANELVLNPVWTFDKSSE